MSVSDKEIGARLSRARKAAGLTYRQLAVLMGVSYPMVYQWESGKKPIAAKHWAGILKHLDISREWLLGTSKPLSEAAVRNIRGFHKLTPEDQKSIRELLEMLPREAPAASVDA